MGVQTRQTIVPWLLGHAQPSSCRWTPSCEPCLPEIWLYIYLSTLCSRWSSTENPSSYCMLLINFDSWTISPPWSMASLFALKDLSCKTLLDGFLSSAIPFKLLRRCPFLESDLLRCCKHWAYMDGIFRLTMTMDIVLEVVKWYVKFWVWKRKRSWNPGK